MSTLSTPRCSEHLEIEPGALHRGHVVGADAVDVLLHVHHFAGPLREDVRDQDVGLAPEVAFEALDVVRLGGEIQLAHHRAAKLFEDAHRLIAARLGYFLFDELREMRQQPQVGLYLGFDTRAADLQHDCAAVVQPRAMHLRDGGGSRRLPFEIDEGFRVRRAERPLDHRQDLFERHRRRVAAQAREFRGPLRWEQILAHREHLPQLDEGGAELFEGETQALLRLELRTARDLAPKEHFAGALEERRDAEPPHEIAESVADEYQADLVQARQVPHRTGVAHDLHRLLVF